MADRKKSANRHAAAKSGAPRGRAPGLLVLACAVLAAGAAAASYANSLAGDFFYDNQSLIRDNPMVGNPEMAGRIFASHYWAMCANDSQLYRPLTIWTYHVQHPKTPESRAGTKDALDSRPYHFVNLVLHALNAALVFAALLFILRKVSVEDRWNVAAACLGAALFAAHPVTTEAVTNIVGRADLLVMLFLLLGLLAHMRGGERGGLLPYYALAAVSMALGLLSKENAIAIIAVFFLYDILFLWPRRAGNTSFVVWLLERIKSCYWLYALVIAGWFFVRYLVLRDLFIVRAGYIDNPLGYAPFLQREATALVMLGLYLWRMVWPVTLSADYSPEQIPVVQSVFDSRFLCSAAALIAIGIVSVFMWRRSRPAAFLMLFFFVAIFPVSNLVVLTGTIGAERLLYVSSLGWAGCLAVGGVYLARVLGRRIGRTWAAVPLALLGAIVILYGIRTHLRNNDWDNEMVFWRATAAASDRSARALNSYALALYNIHDPAALEKSRLLLERAVAITDFYVPVHASLGVVYCAMAKSAVENGNFDSAAGWYEKAYEALQRGRREDQASVREAREELAASGANAPPFIAATLELYIVLGQACSDRGSLLLQTGARREGERSLEDAAESYRIVMLNQPDEPGWHYEYGKVLLRLAELRGGDERRLYEDAAVSLWRAIALNVPGGNAWRDLTKCYAALGHRRDLIVEGRTGFTYARGENENRLYQTRAFRSLIMISRAMFLWQIASDVARIAAQYDIPRSALEGALNGKFSVDDPRIFTGE